MNDRLLEAKEVAALLAIPERWVREQTRRGLIPHVRLGRYRRYRREAILAWIEREERGEPVQLEGSSGARAVQGRGTK